ncbi:MAG: HAD-IC family P-type ATPase [Roseiflexaceae bacterium]
MLPPTPPVTGLSQSEAVARQPRQSPFLMTWHRITTYSALIVTNVVTALNMVILGLATTLWSLGNLRDAFATSLVVILNVVVSIVQSVRARIALDRIHTATLAPVIVWRDQQRVTIDPAHIVVGDVVLVRPGDVIVADGIVLVADACTMDEALLTGESAPVRRYAGESLTSGTTCVAGAAWYQVTTVDGVLSRMNRQVQQMRHIRTPLIDEVQRVIRIIVVIAIILMGVVCIRAWWFDVPYAVLVPQLTVMAGLIPNALVLMLTISYALGAVTMSRHGGLVQQLAAVESLSHVDALCFDKTGTLTANRLVVEELRPLAVSATEFTDALGRYVAADGAANRTAQAIATVVSAPPEPELASVPFDSIRKWSMRITASGVWVLGAPDSIRPHLVDGWQISFAPDAIANGARVVLLAHAPLAAIEIATIADTPYLPDNCVPYGVAVLVDEMRADVQSVITQYTNAGVALYILSGDDPDAVAQIAQQAGIASPSIVHGNQIDDCDDSQLARLVHQSRIFGRVTPDHKQRIIAALQRAGQRVAMVGDGINDIPALKQADVAIAMQSGSAAVRQLADVVLLDDQVGVLHHMGLVGRQIYTRMNVVLNHFLFRVMMSALVLSVGLFFGRVLWNPIDSSLLALIGVALPALIIVSWPQLELPMRLQLRHQLWRDAWHTGVVLVCVTGVMLWLVPHLAPSVMLGVCILVIWGRIIVGFLRTTT